MALKPFPGFKSLKTDHCVTGSMRHIYEFHGYPISEDLLLGLGEGLSFIYWHMTGMRPLLGGRGNVGRPKEEGLERAVGRCTGVTVERLHTGSARKAEAELLKLLEAGEPTMVVLDMGFLPYFDLPEDYHFGGHVVTVCGYDAASRQVLLADRDKGLHPVSLEVLAQARGSKFKPFPPMNMMFTFDFSEARKPQPREIRQAIGRVVKTMLQPPIANVGVKGIRTAARRVGAWAILLDEADLRQTCLEAWIMIDYTGGTGGGLFRYMYGRFLEEAAKLTRDKELAAVGRQMRAVGDHWQEVATSFKEASEATKPAASLTKISDAIQEIAGLEDAAWEELAAVVLSEDHWEKLEAARREEGKRHSTAARARARVRRIARD